MRFTNSAYLPDESIYPFDGADFLAPSTQISPSSSPQLSNVDVELGHLRKRRGYTTLGTGSLNGTVLALVEFKDISNAVHQVCITTTREYELVAGAWTDITYVTTVPARVDRTGTERDGVDWLVTTGKDSTGAIVKWLIITNGVDAPRYWDGTTAHFKLFSTDAVASNGAALDYTGFVTCKTLASINGYLILGNVTTSGPEPVLIAWSDTVELTKFFPGNSGDVNLVDAGGSIQRLIQLGDRLMVYSEDSIHSMFHIGGNDIFSFEKIVSNTRLLSPRAIADVGPFHFFMSQETVYVFDGTRGLRRAGDRITRRYREVLQSDEKSLAFAFLDQPKNCVYFSLPTSSNSATVFKLEFSVFDIGSVRWNVHEYSLRVSTMGFFTNTSSLMYNSASIASTTYSQAGGSYNQGSTNQGFPRRVLGHVSLVSLADGLSLDDGTTAISSEWESMDFTIPKEFLSEHARWTEIEFEARGTAVDVSTSFDLGGLFTLNKSQTLTGNWAIYRIYLDTTSQTMRVKFGSNLVSADWEVRFMRVWFAHSGGA